MISSPWLTIVLLGIAIAGYAWMMPKTSKADKDKEFVSEAAYDRLLEDLETENRELVDAVAKFKREQDETVNKLGRRIVDLESQMKLWQQEVASARFPHETVPALTPTAQRATDRPPEVMLNHKAHSVPSFSEVLEAAVQEPIEPIIIPPNTIRARYPELLSMHDTGRSIEQIAKAMGMNKGEVQLILQLVRREEEQHA